MGNVIGALIGVQAVAPEAPTVETGTQVVGRSAGWQRGHCFYFCTGMEVNRLELTIGQGIIARLATPSKESKPGKTRNQDQTSAAFFAVTSPVRMRTSKEPLPMFMDTLYKAREFDPL